jgi:hypothetical protein
MDRISGNNAGKTKAESRSCYVSTGQKIGEATDVKEIEQFCNRVK